MIASDYFSSINAWQLGPNSHSCIGFVMFSRVKTFHSQVVTKRNKIPFKKIPCGFLNFVRISLFAIIASARMYPIKKGWHGARKKPIKGNYNFLGVDEAFTPWIFMIRSSSEDLLQKIPEIASKAKEAAKRAGIDPDCPTQWG